MTSDAPVIRGQSLGSPYPSVMHPIAEASFNSLDYGTQTAVDHVLNRLEWTPLPDDARDVMDDGETYHAVRCDDVWIIYAIDDAAGQLYVWRVSRRPPG